MKFSSTERLINKHGVDVVFTSVTEGAYDVETGTSSSTTTTTTVKSYPKRLKVSQYNYPNLVGKDVVEFLVPASYLSESPKVNDKITYDGSDYTIDSCVAIVAYGEKKLFKVISVKQ